MYCLTTYIGRSGGAQRWPPSLPNFFFFIQHLRQNGQISRYLPGFGAILWKIMDPPLTCIVTLCYVLLHTYIEKYYHEYFDVVLFLKETPVIEKFIFLKHFWKQYGKIPFPHFAQRWIQVTT